MISHTELLLRLALAAGLGALIGIDRERLAWAAGLRTHMLVATGSALFMLVSAYGFADALHQSGDVHLDVSRVASQVVSGIGFLGAGTIMLRRQIVHGLTTAASLWSVAAVGLAAGGGMYVASVGATVLILVILVLIKPLEARMRGNRHDQTLTINFARGSLTTEQVQTMLDDSNLKQRGMTLKSDPRGDEEELRIALTHCEDRDAARVVDALRALQGVRQVALDERSN
ncbi:MAG: MgtC/SapB family protein [Rhodocyclaceae bacterium]